MIKNKQTRKRKTSIKVKLVYLPLFIIFLAIIAISAVSSFFVRDSLLTQMRENGISLAQQVSDRSEDNRISLVKINEMLEDKITVAGNVLISNEDQLSNEFLSQVMEDTGVTEIYWYSPDGEVIYSTVDSYLGWVPPSDHPVDQFRLSGSIDLMEEIREDTVSGVYYKFGYLRHSDGHFAQIGIDANEVELLTQSFSYQELVRQLGEEHNIVYASVLNTDAEIIAHNNEELVGLVNEDKLIEEAVKQEEMKTAEHFNEDEQINVYSVTLPMYEDHQYVASLNLGLSMEEVNASIIKNIVVIAIVGVITFIILSIVLWVISNGTAKFIHRFKEILGVMSSGDLTYEIPEKILYKNDEFGEMAVALDKMKLNTKEMIKNISITSEQVAASSEELTATSQDTHQLANEVAKAIEEIATGATNQASDVEEGVRHISELGVLIENNHRHLHEANVSAQKVSHEKDEGFLILQKLVEKTNEINNATKVIHDTIKNTGESVEKIAVASQMIKGITEQTNLLALNAAIEAARAGEHGRGFAIVADEVKKLAESSSEFAEEISNVVHDLTNKTNQTVHTMEEVSQIVEQQTVSVTHTNNKFEGIATAIEQMSEVMIKISQSGNDMEAKKKQLIEMVENLSAISEENAAATEESSASVEEQTVSIDEISKASEELAKLAQNMQDNVSKFKY
ncbi:methyl-accepting chemotaxis protein [Alkalihalobacillus trypoxylicola]|uniref:Chemotaxis protein n=1 Tax=Alkalihalobacillus trypoxylicola TaxID=519424 RepID=A0A161PJU4_9BACI|nr:methyl-accepting chemotaxis protein [Alkalihalobacillus trypoxylicola]KYG29591.1 hypothetical protein AZF04_08740 [Alkalihalobacillus trypoxylicola]